MLYLNKEIKLILLTLNPMGYTNQNWMILIDMR